MRGEEAGWNSGLGSENVEAAINLRLQYLVMKSLLKSIFTIHSLSAQMILSFTLVVILTAVTD
ncbi:MAG: hypothetical protein AB1345_12720 [Chloroflexota bacterium]